MLLSSIAIDVTIAPDPIYVMQASGRGPGLGCNAGPEELHGAVTRVVWAEWPTLLHRALAELLLMPCEASRLQHMVRCR